jgi:hypothetical protein
MFRPNETANDLFRRLHNRSFDLRSKPDRVEPIPFGNAVEVQCPPFDLSEVVCTRYCTSCKYIVIMCYLLCYHPVYTGDGGQFCVTVRRWISSSHFHWYAQQSRTHSTFRQPKTLTQFEPCRWKFTQCTVAKSSESDAYNSVSNAL